MNRKSLIGIFCVCALTLLLTACSYVVDTFSYLQNGQLHFDIKPGQKFPTFGADAKCVKEVRVEVRERKPAERLLPDGTKESYMPEIVVWEYGDRLASGCLLSFPIKYGQAKNRKLEKVRAKSLQTGVAYELTTFSSGSGYGGHVFELKSMMAPVDLPPPWD